MSNGQTSWEEPAELAVESLRASVVPVSRPKAASSDIVSSWRELVTKDGRKYYYNAVTKVSMWEIPPEYAEYLERMKDPALLDKEELENRFLGMLKEKGITLKYSWEEALREIINHPHYKMIPTLAEKKTLFAKHMEFQKEIEKGERHQRIQQEREAFKSLLARTTSITPSTRYSEALDLLENQPEFKAISNPKERSIIFDEFISVLKREEGEKTRQRRRRAADKFQSLLENISEIQMDTLWHTARGIFTQHSTFINDEDLNSMDSMEQLIGYENHIKALERKEEQRIGEAREEERKRERVNRKAYKARLDEFEKKGILTATTSWIELYPLIKGCNEFQAMLSQSGGSTPLDLFWDRIHLLQEKYLQEIIPMINELKENDDQGWINTLVPDRIKSIAEKHQLSSTTINSLIRHLIPHPPQLIPTTTVTAPLDRSQIISKVDTFRREHRKLVDRLKHCIKHFTPPIELSSTYEQFRELLSTHPDAIAVEDDQIRQYYFEKFIRHLHKKAGIDTAPSDDDRK